MQHLLFLPSMHGKCQAPAALPHCYIPIPMPASLLSPGQLLTKVGSGSALPLWFTWMNPALQLPVSTLLQAANQPQQQQQGQTVQTYASEQEDAAAA
jgi:hypothetical protein